MTFHLVLNKYMYYRFVPLPRQLRQGSHDAKYSEAAGKEMIHNFDSS